MKKLAILAGALALGLGACGQNNGLNIGQGFDIKANVITDRATAGTPTDIGGAIVGKTGSVLPSTLVFTAKPQSLGFQMTSYTVEILDQAGVRYAADLGLYKRAYTTTIAPGFICSVVDSKNPVPPLYQCAPTDKVASNVVTTVSALPLIINEVARQVAVDCAAARCPTLKIKVTISGVDDGGRAQTIVTDAANISIN